MKKPGSWLVLVSFFDISHYGSMGLVYLPTFTITNQPNVGIYTIHGSYGYDIFPDN